MHVCACTHTLQDMHVYTHTCTHAHKQCVGRARTAWVTRTHTLRSVRAHTYTLHGAHAHVARCTHVCAHTHTAQATGAGRDQTQCTMAQAGAPWHGQGTPWDRHPRDAMGQARDATGGRRASTGNREHLEPRWDRQEEECTVEWAAPPAPHPLHCATPPLPWQGAPPPPPTAQTASPSTCPSCSPCPSSPSREDDRWSPGGG